jgi:hypothetical protein
VTMMSFSSYFGMAYSGALKNSNYLCISDNKDLSVETPDGDRIDKENPTDPVTGGVLEEDVVPGSNGFHSENIYFPMDYEIVSGLYLIKLEGFSDSEAWKIAVALEGEEISAFDGTDATTSLAIDIVVPPNECEVPANECCSDSDCSLDEVCQSRNCIKKGVPRFTLSWYGAGKSIS